MRRLVVLAHRVERSLRYFQDRAAFELLGDARAMSRRQPLNPRVVAGDDDADGAGAAGTEPLGQVA